MIQAQEIIKTSDSGGLRFNGIIRHATEGNPLISIITVTLNAVNFLERTIESIISQTYKNIEYIIIDGGSTDNTLNIIKKHEKIIDYWKSEPDKGIYDAMNKGILSAMGEWVYLINSDDYLIDNNVIADVVSYINQFPNVDLFYGNAIKNYSKPNFKVLFSLDLTENNLRKGRQPQHQAFVRRDAFLRIGLFDTSYKSSSDFDFYCRIFKNDVICQHIKRVFAVTYPYGFSSNKELSMKETSIVIKKHFGEAVFNKYKRKIHFILFSRRCIKRLKLWYIYLFFRGLYYILFQKR